MANVAIAIPDIAPRRGRPRKFAEPSRAVTLTLPEAVITTLTAIDQDLSRAVARLAQPEVAKLPHPPAEVVAFGQRAVIVVTPTRTLEQRTGVVLVPLPDGRALISFDGAMTPEGLELLIQDALDDHDLPDADGRVFEEVRSVLKRARQGDGVSLRRQQIMVLEFNNRRRRPGPSGRSAVRRRHAAR